MYSKHWNGISDRCSVLLVSAILLACGPAFAVQAVAQPAGTTAPERVELDEVTVMGKKLYQMRKEIVEAEDRFYAAFNELNTNDDYDVHCATEARTGTRIRNRVCKPVFYANAQENEARAMLTGDYAPPADLVALERSDDYRKGVLAVINKNPKLRRLVRERDELEQHYLKERQARFKGRWILFE
jgi:hypothetical protein